MVIEATRLGVGADAEPAYSIVTCLADQPSNNAVDNNNGMMAFDSFDGAACILSCCPAVVDAQQPGLH